MRAGQQIDPVGTQHTALIVDLKELVCDAARGRLFCRHGADHGIALFLRDGGRRHAEGLRPHVYRRGGAAGSGLAPHADLGDELRDALRVGVALGFVHNDARHGNAAGRAEVARRLIRLVQAHQTTGADHGLVVPGQVILIGILAELGLEGAHALLEAHDVLAADLLALGRIEVLADGAGALAREAARQGGITSRLPLQGAGVRERWFSHAWTVASRPTWLSPPTKQGSMRSIARRAEASRRGGPAQHKHKDDRTYLSTAATCCEGVRYAMRTLALAVLIAGRPMAKRHTRRRRRRRRRLKGVRESWLIRA